jgi:hypothetical protein
MAKTMRSSAGWGNSVTNACVEVTMGQTANVSTRSV